MKKRTTGFLILVLCLPGICACGQREAAPVTGREVMAESLPDQPVDELTGSEFQMVGTSDSMELLLEPDRGIIRWKSKTDGTYYDTKVFDGPSDNMNSDLVVRYFDGPASNPYEKVNSMDTYSKSISTGTYQYQLLENGVRIIYEMGNPNKTYKNFPKYITKERMENLVLQHLDPTQRVTVEREYILTKGGYYSRESSKDRAIRPLAANNLYHLFYEVGKYTADELMEDNLTYEIDPTEYPTDLVITAPIEFTLEGDDLKVRIPTGQMTSNDRNKEITELDFLPYFLNSGETEGYMFVPDGSGALIYFDSTKLYESQFTGRYYGGDKLLDMTSYDHADIQMMMPVFGFKNSNSAVFGVIEEGAEAATLSAYIRDSFQGEKLNRLSLNFKIRERQKIKANTRGPYSDFHVYGITEDYYKDDIVVRYHYLPREKASYVGMAEFYAGYLEEKGVLAKKQDAEDAPFFLELLGATDKERFVAGIPYQGTEQLTSFREAQEILASLTGQGIKNISLIYSGMINGGLNQRYAGTVSRVPGLGSSSDWSSLLNYASDIGALVYPNVKLQTAYTMKKLSGSQVAYTLSNEKAVLYRFDPILRLPETDSEYQQFIINPAYFDTYFKSFSKSYTSLGTAALASDDLLTFLPATYQKGKQISQSSAKKYFAGALETISEGRSLMLSNPADIAYAHTGQIMNLPGQTSGLRILDAGIPFMQMVLNGSITHSTTDINKNPLFTEDDVMRAVEGKSALKFSFFDAPPEAVNKTLQNDRFTAQFSVWEGRIGEIYEQYNAFWQKVMNASVADHQILDKQGLLRLVTYSNGVKVYLNYSDEETTISGVKVAAHSFVAG